MIFSLCKQLTDTAQRVWSCLRRLSWTLPTLLVYWFGGAAVFYTLENSFPAITHSSANKPSVYCLRYRDYWASLHYAATLFTTVGYGNVYCCSWPGRAFTAVYILFGAPLLFIVLDTIGKTLTRLTSSGWRRLKRLQRRLVKFLRRCIGWRRKKTVADRQAALQRRNNSNSSNDEELLPLSIGIAFSITWLLAVSGYFAIVEDWTFMHSMYLVWITFTTVGLGEMAPNKFEYTALNFLLIIIGLSLVSMCINILQGHIETVVNKMRTKIEAQYRDAIVEDEVLQPEQIPTTVVKKKKKQSSLSTMDRLFATLMSRKDRKNVKRLKEKRLAMKNKSVQVDIPLMT